MIYIGIDPGKSGALAYIMKDGSSNAVMFDDSQYKYILRQISIYDDEAVCCLEHVGAMPGQGVTSMFSFGENFGYIKGLLSAYGIPYQLVRPRIWKKEFGVTGDKNTSVEVCKRLFPDVSLRTSDRSRKDNVNLAEAMLMAEYARRRL